MNGFYVPCTIMPNKYRIVSYRITKFGTMIDNMSRMRLNEYHILKIFVDYFMRNSNFGIAVLHVKVKY